jgi:hypothetical protein
MLTIFRKYCDGPDAKAKFVTVYLEEVRTSARVQVELALTVLIV